MIRPAFSSTLQATGFGALLIVLLALAAVMPRGWLPPREQAYAAIGWANGPYPWIRNQIFEEAGDIDILFIGSSRILRGVDALYVQAALTKKLGRPAVVRTIAWSWAGYDALFLVAKDLLQHRKVHQLVFYDEHPAENTRNPAITSLFRFREDASALNGLSRDEQCLYYFATLVGMPRTLLNLMRSNLPASLSGRNCFFSYPVKANTDNPTLFFDAPNRLGAVATRLGYDSAGPKDDSGGFHPYQPPVGDVGREAIYTASNPSKKFEFSNAPLPPWQLHFARLFAALAESHGCQLVMLDVPGVAAALGRSNHVQERTFWPGVLSADIALVGFAPGQLFQGLNDDQIKQLYYDSLHFNLNGMEFFTRLITPGLLEQYDFKVRH